MHISKDLIIGFVAGIFIGTTSITLYCISMIDLYSEAVKAVLQ